MSYGREHRVRDSVRDCCKEPHREQSEPVGPFEVNRGQYPHAQPYQVESYEDALRPWGKTKKRGKPILKVGNKFLDEMHTLHRQTQQKEPRRLLPAGPVAVTGRRRMVSNRAIAAATQSTAVPMSMLRRFSFMAVEWARLHSKWRK